jgi:hypothetical protein
MEFFFLVCAVFCLISSKRRTILVIDDVYWSSSRNVGSLLHSHLKIGIYSEFSMMIVKGAKAKGAKGAKGAGLNEPVK